MTFDASSWREKTAQKLAAAQLDTGGFLYQSRPLGGGGVVQQTEPSVFLTALIGYAIRDSTEPALVATKTNIVAFLQRQISARGSVNYWTRDSVLNTLRPYPDDMDDTCLTWLALWALDATTVTSTSLVQLTELLISLEVCPGGPYRTWLTHSEESVWRDVDSAVNANIARVLASCDALPQSLQSHLAHIVATSQLRSPYYPSVVPVAYYLSYSVTGSTQALLRQHVYSLVQGVALTSYTLLELAMLVSSLIRLDATPVLIATGYTALSNRLVKEDLLPDPVCYDPTLDGVRYVAGSESCTMALCLEAVHLYEAYCASQTLHPSHVTPTLSTDMARIAESVTTRVTGLVMVLPDQLAAPARERLGVMLARDKDHQIRLFSAWFCPVLQPWSPVVFAVLTTLGVSSMLGWLAYDVYDDIADGDAPHTLLPLANVWLRQLTAQYHELLENHPALLQIFHNIMNAMEAAVMEELHMCQVPVGPEGITIPALLPSFTHTMKLAGKSWGHALGPTMAWYLCDSEAGSIAALQAGMMHFIAARQLHDDAHDWLEDLERGAITAANVPLLVSYAGLVLPLYDAATRLTLQQQYWHNILPALMRRTQLHIALARQAFTEAGLPTLATINAQLLEPLELVTKKALHSREETLAFLQQYQTLHTR